MKKSYFFIAMLLCSVGVWGQIVVTPGTGFNLDGKGAGIYSTRPTGADFSTGITEFVLQVITKTNAGAAIDFDGDGNREIVVQTAGSNAGAATQTRLYILEANGNNDFRQRAAILIPQGTNSGAPGLMRGVDVGDIDADAALEIVAISGNGTNSFMTVYDINTSTFAFTELTNRPVFGTGGLFTTSGTVNQLRIMPNKNGGSNNDILISNATGTTAGSHMFAVEYTGSAIAFVNTTAANSGVLVNAGVIAFNLADMGDAADEELLMVTESITAPLTIQEYVTNATTPFGTAKTITTNWIGTTGGSFTTVALGDIDGDADLDVVAGDYNGVQLRAVKRTGVNTYTTEAILSSALASFSPATELSDIDNDGKMEIIYANGTSVVFREHDGTANDFSSARWGAETTLLSGLGTGKASAVSFVGGASVTLENDRNFDIIVGRSLQVTGQGDMDDDELFFLEANRLFTSGPIAAGNYDNIEIQAGTITLAGNVTTNGDLALTSGIVELGANNLTLAGTITDGSSTNYIKTNGTGTVTVNNVTTEILIPLGNTRYNPVLIENSSGHNWAVRVEDGVTADPGLNTDKAVLLTWHITPSVNPPVAPANITFQFDETTQVGPSFVAAENVQAWHRISHWNPQGVPAAVVGLSGAKKAKVLGLTNFSPYALSNPLGPLPITIDYFNGTKQGTNHNLVWKVTCQSTPSATLILERSTDGRNYKEIYSIVATALRCQQPFDHSNTQPEAGTNYYRLKMLDANGKVSYSSIVALLNKQGGFDIIGIAPNPVTSNAILNVTAAEAGTLQIAVSDMNGRKLMTQNETLQAGSKQVVMNLNKLPTGTYQVTAYYSDGTKKTVRLVKQ